MHGFVLKHNAYWDRVCITSVYRHGNRWVDRDQWMTFELVSYVMSRHEVRDSLFDSMTSIVIGNSPGLM